MKRSTFEDASFEQCKLTGVDFSDAEAIDLSFKETLLINVKRIGISFRKVNLEQLDFSQSDLRQYDFWTSSVDSCNLREIMMDDARFEGVDLRKWYPPR
ncbi:pentapeptide repeat-containing protein [Parasphingorhabdus sp. JC815]|uniref:pentapeptide repeat-containing protein n=1 Tax=Parasphingorhabdus sp. JC815 TaxID=3232140 RepID=UPI00345984D3